ncbi:SusD/RagB family nutrient-binding outer membrane lipoprotein [Flavobacterium sp. KJJ]|uniref:SusD/RagB family nutrient-binding outer membrane lipoprotein n=1 Tax=Flavobacterium sp. KJJ TaxID=1270193 RepID=UPI00049340F6|nr:SusD/RagB family nutrient-binding outer membrane lipoprotein [Flavobacterium sp. KJJ]
MKNIKTYIAALGLVTTMISCNDLEDINVNPSFPVDVSATALMPPIEQQMAVGLQFDNRCLGRYIQNFSIATTGAVGSEWDRFGYQANSDTGGEIWKMAYFAIGLNLTKLQEKAAAEQRHDITGISKVIRAWSWQVATDYHSELIDFDQVFTQRLSFDYVSQEKVYAEVVRLLDEGLIDLNRTDGNVSQTYTAAGDKMYGGDRSKWIKFAYGVLARNLNNQINKASYDPNKVIEYCDKSLASNADNALIRYNGTVSADINFYGPGRNNFSTYRQTDFAVRTMDGTIFGGVKDPRISRVLAPSVGLSETAPASAANPDPSKYTFNGNPLNTTASTVATNVSRIPNIYGTYAAGTITTPGRYIFRDKANFPLMTYSEIQFIKAEAAFIKGDKAMALDAYKKAIDANIDFVNTNTVVSTTFPITSTITAAEKTAFLTDVNIVPAAANLTISHIMLQKYVALFGYGMLETWTDLRKYHYDNTNVYKTMTFAPNGGLFVDNNGKLPYRVRPRFNSEYVWNFDALKAIGADKVDYHTVEMWFSKP